jgi:hypothetical protein|tara:strand:+ start:164 stop:325 length:162 start_codon:yes stop_codon:yes gene_type:complete
MRANVLSHSQLQVIGMKVLIPQGEYKDGFNSFYPLIGDKKQITGTRIQWRKQF